MNLVLEITSQFRHLGCLKEKTISSNKTYSRHEYSMKKDEIDIIHFEDLIQRLQWKTIMTMMSVKK